MSEAPAEEPLVVVHEEDTAPAAEACAGAALAEDVQHLRELVAGVLAEVQSVRVKLALCVEALRYWSQITGEVLAL